MCFNRAALFQITFFYKLEEVPQLFVWVGRRSGLFKTFSWVYFFMWFASFQQTDAVNLEARNMSGAFLKCLVLALFISVHRLLAEPLVHPRVEEGDGSGDSASTLAFVFDVTGSMYDDLKQVIEGASRILEKTLSRRTRPIKNFVLVPFHDPGTLCLNTRLFSKVVRKELFCECDCLNFPLSMNDWISLKCTIVFIKQANRSFFFFCQVQA